MPQPHRADTLAHPQRHATPTQRDDAPAQRATTVAHRHAAPAATEVTPPHPADALAADTLPPAPQSLQFAPADSTAQAFFNGQPAMLRSFVPGATTAPATGFPLPPDSLFLAQQRTLWDSTSRAIAQAHETLPPRTDGTAGDPVPYLFRRDDVLTSALLLSFLLMVWVVGSSWRFLRDMGKDYFRPPARGNLFDDRSQSVLRGRPLLLLQAGFMHAIFYFDYTRHEAPDRFSALSPHLLLAGTTLSLTLFYLLKIGLYRWVNHTFFTPEQSRHWEHALLSSILLIGTLLLPPALLGVYFKMPHQSMLIAYVLLMSIVKILLFYKAQRTFFGAWTGSVHIILYFCALEIVPTALFWALLQAGTHALAVLS